MIAKVTSWCSVLAAAVVLTVTTTDHANATSNTITLRTGFDISNNSDIAGKTAEYR